MNKYLTVFKIFWQTEFTYRANFILWRFRNVLRLLTSYFLWRGVFSSTQNAFGYSQQQMLTYVVLVLVVTALVSSSPGSNEVGEVIARGDLSNYLLKPVNYLKYVFAKDLSSKVLNLSFSIVEITIIWLLFKPQLSFHLSLITLPLLILSLIGAIFINFFLSTTTRFIAFWSPENTWPMAYLTYVFVDLLSGGIFPLDIIPKWANIALQFTPFPYMIYFPLAIYLGKLSLFDTARVVVQTVLWVYVLYALNKFVWKKGLRNYAAYGS